MFCITGTQNRALTISSNNATVEFYSTGIVTSYKCVLDRSEIIENCEWVAYKLAIEHCWMCGELYRFV